MRGIQIQLTVIHALVLRETRTRFGDQRLGYFWALFEPIVMIATFVIAFQVAHHAPPAGMDLVPFIATGLLPYELVMNTADRCAESINGNRSLLFYPQVHRLDIVYARALLEGVTIVVVFVIILGTHAAVFGGDRVDDPLALMASVVLCSLFGMALGLVYCMAGVLTTLVDRVRGPVSRPLFWISGIFFTADAIPADVRSAARLNPILHVIEMLRSAFFPGYDSKIADPGYVVAWVLGLLTLGLVLERVARRRIEVAV